MIDWDDVDDFGLMAFFSSGWTAVVFLLLMIVFSYFACVNTDECSKKTCPNDTKPRLMDHSCLCVSEAK